MTSSARVLLLPVGVSAGLLWANTAPASYFTTVHSLSFAVNQIGMALFFGLVAQEIVEATMRGGALHTWRRWSLPLAGAMGGVVVSALAFLAYVSGRHELMLVQGWPAATAVDVAFAYLVVHAIFGRHAAVPFVLILAMASNVPALLVAAIEGNLMQARPGGTALVALAIGSAWLLRQQHVRSVWPYVLGCGTVSWYGFYLHGAHPALALVPIVPFMVHTPRGVDLFEDHGPHRSHHHFEHVFEYPVYAVLFLFALVNAGGVISGYGTGTWGTLIAALGGRTAGVLAGVALAVAAGLHLPPRVHWRELLVIVLAATPGFAFALFFAVVSYAPGPLLTEIKLGALLTAGGALLAWAAARMLHVGRFAAVVLILLLPLGAAAQEVQPMFGSIGLLDRAVELVDARGGGRDAGGGRGSGFYPEFGNMITGAGWIALGPGYRHLFAGDRALVDASAAISWRGYKIAQARSEFTTATPRRVSVGAQAFWRDYTQVSYFGIGREAAADARSEYRLQAFDVTGYATIAATSWLSAGGRIGWLDAPGIDSAAGPFRRDLPDTRAVFSDDPGVSLAEQPSYVHGEVWFVSDTRNHRGYPTRGGLYRAGRTTYVDRRDGAFSFGRYDLDALQVVPWPALHAHLALRATASFSDTAERQTVPFYLLPSLGGHNTLRGYSDYRFHDRHALAVNVESRWLVFTNVDAVAFFDAGNVAARAKDLDLGKRVYGAGVRLHTAGSTLLRLDAGHGTDGWHVALKLTDPFRLSRLSRMTAAIPFVP